MRPNRCRRRETSTDQQLEQDFAVLVARGFLEIVEPTFPGGERFYRPTPAGIAYLDRLDA